MTNSNLNQIQNLTAKLVELANKMNNVEVTVGQPFMRNNSTKFPVRVTDKTQGSFTQGWSIEYTPNLNRQSKLVDSASAINRVIIPNYDVVREMVVTAHNQFLQGVGVSLNGNNQRSAKYEQPNVVLDVFENQSSLAVQLKIVDETSPFYLLLMNFTVMQDRVQIGNLYVGDTDKNFNPQTRTTFANDAYLGPKKHRYYKVNRINGQDQVSRTISYVQNAVSIERKFATLFDAYIMNYAFDKVLSMVLQQAPQQPMNNNFNQGVYGLPRQNNNVVNNGQYYQPMNQGGYATQYGSYQNNYQPMPQMNSGYASQQSQPTYSQAAQQVANNMNKPLMNTEGQPATNSVSVSQEALTALNMK